MDLAFEKWHGCLNDFIVTWVSDLDDLVLASLKRQAAQLCHRHGGVGADGILVLQTRTRADLTPDRLTIINSDGSIARNCGNGLRCAALSVLKRHREQGDPRNLPEMIELAVEGVPMLCRFMKTGAAFPLVAVDMGVPALGDDVPWYQAAEAAVRAVGSSVGEPKLAAGMSVCDLGNPHIVITSERGGRDLLLKVGPPLQNNAAWDGMNVHLVTPAEPAAKDQARAGLELGSGSVISELYQAWVWERGAGETMACGSGACAIGAAALATGLTERGTWIAVDMPGGRLYVRQDSAREPVLLAGPGVYVFSGKLVI